MTAPDDAWAPALRPPWTDETGSGTATVLGTALLAAGLLAAVLAVGESAVVSARASGAADLAALAAADARRGLTDHDPCGIAEDTAERNGAVVTACTAREDGSMLVAVEVRRGPLPLPPGEATAVAGAPLPGAGPG